jgi:hypothetical protein
MKCNERNCHANYAAMCAVYYRVEVLLKFDDRPFTHIAMNRKISVLTAVKQNHLIFLELRIFFEQLLILCVVYFVKFCKLCILIVLLICTRYYVYSLPTGIPRLPWLRFLRAFPSLVRQMPGYTSQKRGTVSTLPNYLTVLFYLLFVSIVLFYVLFVC